MSIDRRTLVTGLVSAGALLQTSTHGQAASAPEINASVGATLERFYYQVPGAQGLAARAAGVLDRLRARQQGMRGQRRIDGDAQVHKRRLVFDAPRRRQVVGGAGKQADVVALAQHCDRVRKRGTDISEIAAKRQQRFSHGGRARG